MAEWVWEAKARTGETRKGVMEADTLEVVEQRLRTQQLNPVKVKKKPKDINITIGTGVSDKDLVIFIRQFATMIDAGLPLVQCLDILSTQGENAVFRKLLTDVKAFVEQGGTFSDALREHPKVFDDLFVNLIQAGEVGGILDAILRRLAIYIEKRVKLQRQVRSALIYPSAVLIIAFAVIAIMLQFVIPTFQDMFRQFGSEDGLPWLTQKIISFSVWFRNNVIFLILGIIATSTAISYSYRTPKGKRFWHKTMITVPVLGPVMRKIAVARFTRTMGTLLSSGVPILDAMAIVARAAGNVIVEEAINKTASQVREGRTMSEPLMETNVFPSMVVQMIAVGEQTGALDTMLNKIADFYEEEVDVAVAGLMSLIEPFMMVFIGGIVGTILIGMYLPIFTIADNIRQ
ncbi:MAG: type II secretion system F family protein [Myxococcales bacterium]|nr:type II secretion system F family protein [Myxococcales bacterium]MCB9626128.1 type II secretion system F family protein [Sandaracinaceae bacterium]